MKMMKHIEAPSRAEMLPEPLPEKKSSVADAVAAAAKIHVSSAAALIGALGSGFSREDAQSVLWSRVEKITRLATRPMEAPQEFAFCELLMSKGADPLLTCEKRFMWLGAGSILGALVEAGAWQYARQLIDKAGPAGKDQALALLSAERGGIAQLHSILGARGPEAIAFAADIGMDMSATVFGEPWAAMSESAADFAAFAKAGANLSAKDGRGRSLAEIFAARNGGPARQALIKAAAGVSEAPRGEAAVAMMEKIAVEGSFKEFAALAKGAGLSPGKAFASNGRTMLGVALQSANWTMARGLIAAGANPMEPCGEDGIPAGAYALIASAVKRKTKAQIEGEGAILEGIFSKMDFGWRSADGLPMLEAVAASSRRAWPTASIFWNSAAAIAWGAVEPESRDNPLWARFLNLGVKNRAVAAVGGARVGESEWSPDGMGILAWAIARTHGDGEEGRAIDILVMARRAAAAATMPGKLADGDKVMDLFSRPQWDAAIKSIWDMAALAHEKKIAEGEPESARKWLVEFALSRLQTGMAHWEREARDRAIAFIDEKTLGEWAMGSWRDDDPDCGKWAGEIMLGAVGSRAGQELGRLLLDLAIKGTPKAIKAACSVWRRMETYGLSEALPKEHPIYEADSALIAELDQTSLGAAIGKKTQAKDKRPPEPPATPKNTRRL